ncbi:MAG: alpha/beta hydrolase family protein [Planctomycetota bacterium]
MRAKIRAWTPVLSLVIVPILLGCALEAQAPTAVSLYDPLQLPVVVTEVVDLEVSDSVRQRGIPLRIYLPAEKTPAPIVLYSHGLGGTREICEFLGRHWSARGYLAVFLQHPGSDDSVWKDVPPAQRMAAMQKAASMDNLVLRAQDVTAVLDQLGRWQLEVGHALAGRLDLTRIGMSGHSFGAKTTQAVSGQSMPIGGGRFTDKRIQAAIAFSPSSPQLGDPARAFASVRIPWLLMTGTNDVSIIGNTDVESRRAVFKNLPAGDKFELVLDKTEHSAFTERPLPGDIEKRNPNHHRVILALTTAFWDTYLLKDSAARSWIQSDAPRVLMEPADVWQRK